MRRRYRRLLARAHRLEESEQWRLAAEAYRAALDRDDRDPRVHYRLGFVLSKAGNLIGAVEAYQAAIARDDRSGQWHFRLGRALERTGNWPAARHAYREAESRGKPQAPTLEGSPGNQLPYLRRIELNLVDKASYAYGLLRAAESARKLGVARITAVELGVAGGNGLVRLEQHAEDVEAMTGVGIDVYGFDTGEGMQPAVDHRDLPYHFAEGNYRMNVEALQERLRRAELILGDAAETFATFLESDPAPLGFVSFDMDHYTPTRATLSLLGDGSKEDRFLPRMALYFDDVVGRKGQDYNEFTGELLAIAEHNREHESVKVAEDRHFRALPLNFGWHHSMYTMHRFAHPEYGTFVHKAGPSSLSLKA